MVDRVHAIRFLHVRHSSGKVVQWRERERHATKVMYISTSFLTARRTFFFFVGIAVNGAQFFIVLNLVAFRMLSLCVFYFKIARGFVANFKHQVIRICF